MMAGDDAGGMPIGVGDPAPWFVLSGTDPSGPYHFDKAGGRYVVMLFAPSVAALQPVLARMADGFGLLDSVNRMMFTITPDGAGLAPRADAPGLVHLFDADGAVSRLYGYGGAGLRWLLLDPLLRVVAVLADDAGTPGLVMGILASVPAADARPMPPAVPIAILPDVFEPAFCERLIGEYHRKGFHHSGVFTESSGETSRAMDMGFKRRRDCLLDDPALKAAASARIMRRIVPEIRRVFQVECGYLDRMIIASYDAIERGRFGAHRDNTMQATAYRQFALSINLNDGFTGGGVCFPEYGPAAFTPPAGGAVIFSCGLLHRVDPVTAGARFACLSFTYDEASAVIRRRNWEAGRAGARVADAG